MDLTERNVIESLSEIAPYIEADGGFVEFVEIEEDTKFVKNTDNQRNIFIVETNRKYLWKQTWIININWFVCNLGLYFISRNITPVDNFWSEGL